ncbi:carboxypeptidase-like regulatory domain-containing protein [Hymenobacter properus]|uniref:Carboxypeptidase-like regulatory domain-containing protein n=1 Tax=Hymenobacter properus TaxID=2791026 RepID=A0A931BK48_9BACT|nr:carboxypeptidase-like regulatory domain-containing protein [Hymenobacter properus]MBF9143777.1 carboxypeptidase-like regulatory domain-containing protein [Hymenobacter properus]MBR7722590.1 carboxypeptidase-like regulatory domain-containing protein [Microvirga sp. SRT04]
MRLSALFLAFSLSFIANLTSQAQVVASNAAFASADNGPTTGPGASAEKVVLVGKITNPSGPLPGAVVILKDTKQMAVTNADGEFEFTVPANAGSLDAVVTYAGYADEKMTLNTNAEESTVSLTNARVIVVSRKNQLKKYLKTAKKQVKRELKQVRKG